MKQFFLLFALLFTLSTVGYAQTTAQQHAFDNMLKDLLSHSVKEVRAKELINNATIVFLDARELAEYNVSHIPNAKWIGYNTFKKKAIADLPKNQAIVVYCSVGYRSEKITEKLLKMGFTDVSNLYGGIFDWKHAGGKLVDQHEKETEKVHTYDKNWGQWLFKGIKVN